MQYMLFQCILSFHNTCLFLAAASLWGCYRRTVKPWSLTPTFSYFLSFTSSVCAYQWKDGGGWSLASVTVSSHRRPPTGFVYCRGRMEKPCLLLRGFLVQYPTCAKLNVRIITMPQLQEPNILNTPHHVNLPPGLPPKLKESLWISYYSQIPPFIHDT